MSFRTSMANLASILKIEGIDEPPTTSGSGPNQLPVDLCCVVAGRKLSQVDEFAKPSPYVLLKYNNKTKSTDVISDTNSPKWRIGSLSAEFSFRANPAEKVISLVIMDWQGESGYDRVIGTIDVDVQAVIEIGDKVIDEWIDIQPPVFSFGSALMKLATEVRKEPISVGQLHLRIWVEKKKVSVEKSPLWQAVQTKLVDDVRMLLKSITFRELTSTNTFGETVLHVAVVRKDWDTASSQILLILLEDERLDVNATNQDDNTPFHYFCQRYTGPHPFGPFDRFVERGADIHSKNKFGETPLHKAIFHPSLKLTLIDLLVQRDADLNAQTVTGDTPLHYAVHLGRDDVVRYLLQKGADPLTESNDGKTSLDVAKNENPVIATRIEDTIELQKWLRRNDLLDYAEEFISNDLFLYIVPDLTDEFLERILPDDYDRTKVLRAVRRFKRELGSFRATREEIEKKEQFERQKQQLKLADKLRQSLDAAAARRLSMSVEQDDEDGSVDLRTKPEIQMPLRDSLSIYRSKKNTLRRIVVSKEKKRRVVAEKERRKRDDSITSQSRTIKSPSRARQNSTSEAVAQFPQTTSQVSGNLAGLQVAKASNTKETSPSPRKLRSDSCSFSSAPSVENDNSLSWEIDIREINFLRSLGMGSSGEVFLGKYNGELVAVKVLHHKNTDNEIDEFKKEFQVLITIKSDYVVKFYGATVQSRLSLVMEYCAKGSLFDVLRSPSIQLAWEEFFLMASDIARGLSNLHGRKPEILHRDLKTLNLLVTDQLRIKLCDFGLSRFNTGSNLATLSKQRGTYAYIAPEIYDCVPFTTKADVYSIAIVFWEMLFRLLNGFYRRPYKEYSFIRMDFQTLVMARKKNLRPTLPEETPQSLKDLVCSMWDADPDLRPDAHMISESIDSIQREYEAHKKKWIKLLEKAIIQQTERQAAVAAAAAAAAESSTSEFSMDLFGVGRPRRDSDQPVTSASSGLGEKSARIISPEKVRTTEDHRSSKHASPLLFRDGSSSPSKPSSPREKKGDEVLENKESPTSKPKKLRSRGQSLFERSSKKERRSSRDHAATETDGSLNQLPEKKRSFLSGFK